MIQAYNNNDEIVLFLNRAQNKIASLSSLLVERTMDLDDDLIILLELSDFIEELDSKYCTWLESDILRWIHAYNHRANLNAIPYLNIANYTSIINVGNSGSSGINLPIYTKDIVDYLTVTTDLITKFPHNNLYGIQGGLINERYHMDKTMHDFLYNMVYPNITASVNLVLTTTGTKWPSGYYELGNTVPVVNLAGSIIYGTSNKANYFEYRKNEIRLGLINSNPPANSQPNAISDTVGIKVDTSYSFTASLPEGIKSITKKIEFRQPMYYGVIKRNEVNKANVALRGTKDVRDRGAMQLSFNLPAGNTLLSRDQSLTPYLFIPSSWGKFTSAISQTFEFVNDWYAESQDMLLADGTRVPGLLILYGTQMEGPVTFNFIF